MSLKEDNGLGLKDGLLRSSSSSPHGPDRSVFPLEVSLDSEQGSWERGSVIEMEARGESWAQRPLTAL